jgi:hypothetical protein
MIMPDISRPDKSRIHAAPRRAPGKRHKTLVFHIGDHKTGSTSIQLAFAQRQVVLQNHSVFYPARLASNMLKPYFRAYARPSDHPTHSPAVKVFKDLARKIRNADADFCLISAEVFEKIDAAVFHDVVTTFFTDTADEIRIIAYVRPHAARIMSSFAERVKIGDLKVIDGGPQTVFDQSYREKVFPYQARFAALRERFGAAFVLRPMIRSQLFKGSVVKDFIHHAFPAADFRLDGLGAANESLDLENLMRLKILHSHCRNHPKSLRLTLGWEFTRVATPLQPLQNRTRLRLHKSLARDIHAACLEDARAVDQQFFDAAPLLETELHTALDGAAETAQSTDPADCLSASEIQSLTILSKMISTMLENQTGDWPGFLHNKRLIDVLANTVPP